MCFINTPSISLWKTFILFIMHQCGSLLCLSCLPDWMTERLLLSNNYQENLIQDKTVKTQGKILENVKEKEKKSFLWWLSIYQTCRFLVVQNKHVTGHNYLWTYYCPFWALIWLLSAVHWFN